MQFSIGQFSKMTRLSIKALRLYADNGLLPPAYVDPSTGYRYYNPGQAKRAEVVRILRSVDMPLEQIRKILDAKDSEATEKLLVEHYARLSERLASQKRMLAYLQTIIDNKERIMPYEVDVTTIETQFVVGVKLTTNQKKISTDLMVGFGQLMQGLMANSLESSGPPMVIYHDVIDGESDSDIEICAPVANAYSGDNIVQGRELQGGAVAGIVHRGPYEELSSAYHAMFNWLAESSYEPAGSPREIYLNDPQQVTPEELLTRIEFPVKEA